MVYGFLGLIYYVLHKLPECHSELTLKKERKKGTVTERRKRCCLKNLLLRAIALRGRYESSLLFFFKTATVKQHLTCTPHIQSR